MVKTNTANATLVDRDDHSVDAHGRLDVPALFNGNDSLTGDQRVADHVERIVNLAIDDNQLQANIDDDEDSTIQTPAVTAVQSEFMASPEPDHLQPNYTVPERLGLALDNTHVPALQNTRPGECSNLDETYLQLRDNSYPIQRNTTDDINYRPIGQFGNQGEYACRPNGLSGIIGQPSVLHRLESNVSVNQHQTGRSNFQPHGTSETQRDHSEAAVAGAATLLVFSHQHDNLSSHLPLATEVWKCCNAEEDGPVFTQQF